MIPKKVKERLTKFKTELHIESLAFVAFLVTVPFYSPNLVPLKTLGPAEPYISLFVNTLLAFTTILACFVTICSRFPRRLSFHSSIIVCAGFVFYIVGMLLLVLAIMNLWPAEAMARLSSVLCALGIVPLVIAWGRYFSSFNTIQALMHAAVLGGMAAITGMMLSSLSGVVLVLTMILLWMVGSGVPLARNLLGLDICSASFASDHRPYFQTLHAFMSSVGAPLGGLLFFAFIMGTRKFILLESFYAENIGGLLAIPMMILLCLRATEKTTVVFAFRWYLLLFALMLILLDSFPVLSPLNTLGAFGIYAFLTFVTLVTAVSLVAVSHTDEFSPTFVFGSVLCLFSLASLLGVLVGTVPFIADNPGPLLVVLSTFYLVAVVFLALRAGWRKDQNAGKIRSTMEEASEKSIVLPNPRKHTERTEILRIKDRCDMLAQRAKLSPRETEILSYLGRGYPPAYISRVLVLSESTVRTHVHHIYSKLGVASREQCLDLVYEITTYSH